MSIVRLCIDNVIRHAEATTLTLRLHGRAEALYIAVQDNGRGFDANVAANGSGHGMHNAKERAATLGGSFTITTNPGSGVLAELTIPNQML